MATIDDDLAKDVSSALRLAQMDISNQDKLLTGPGDVTILRADGTSVTGPSWPKLSAEATAAGDYAKAAKASATSAASSASAANTSKTAAATSATAAKTSETNAATSEKNAKTSETNAKTSENNAGASASSAAASLAAAQQLTSVPYEAAPYPDVWAPLNDDLRLEAGFAPYDKLTISGQVLELPSRQIPFTRSTTATYIDKSGVVQTAAVNEPRFEREGLLMEGQVTNRALYSGNMDNAWWPTARVSKTSGFPAPDGSLTAIKMVSTTEVGSKYISKPLNVSVGETYTLSFFVKAGEVGQCRVNFSGSASTNNMSCDFDLTTGQVLTATPAGVPSITRLSNDWWRVSARSEQIATAGALNFNIWMINGLGPGATVPPNDGVSGLYVWGAQIEANPVMTSYIPTTTAEVTRAQETLRLQPSGNIGYGVVGDLFNRTISFELSVDAFVPTAVGYFNLLATVGVANDIILRINTTGVNSLRSSGSVSPALSTTYPFSRQIFTQTIDTDNNLTAYFNGQKGARQGAPATTTVVPTTVNFSSTSQLVYHIRNFRIWHRLLTPNQINGLR